MTTTQAEASRTRRAGPGRLTTIGAGAALVAAAATTALAALVRASGVDLVVAGGQEIPATGVGFQTAVWSLIGVTVAAGFRRWSARPADSFVTTSVVLTALSLVPPVVWGEGVGSVAALVVLHLVAAGVVIPVLARVLRAAPDARPTRPM